MSDQEWNKLFKDVRKVSTQHAENEYGDKGSQNYHSGFMHGITGNNGSVGNNHYYTGFDDGADHPRRKEFEKRANILRGVKEADQAHWKKK